LRAGWALLVLATSCAGAQHPQARVEVAYRFVCAPRDARVIVDEVDQGQCILWEAQYLGLGSGTHRLRVERDGYLPIERELPTTGRRETISLQLRPRPE
jgi:hypothetical protein